MGLSQQMNSKLIGLVFTVAKFQIIVSTIVPLLSKLQWKNKNLIIRSIYSLINDFKDCTQIPGKGLLL